MTILFQDAIFASHKTGYHPESPDRTLNMLPRFESWVRKGQVQKGLISSLPENFLVDTHSQEQIALIKRLAAAGGGHIDADTFVSKSSWDVALHAAGSTVSAVEEVLQGRAHNALCLIRPPGHHATHKQSMGFCLLNNVALAVRYAQKIHQLDRVLVVDWDVHHGNGTQDIFYEDESVFFYSIHRFPFYPGTGDKSETGSGPGLGSTLNVPVNYGVSRESYLSLFRQGLDQVARRFKPDLIVISAGFDAHKDDPVGSLGLESEDFRLLTRELVAVAKACCKGRIVSCLEGGYNIDALADSVEHHLDELVAAGKNA